ncbi:hypothetical protein Vadar_012104 [Vaccinium darrowii]|uniref:Uncharacterized protein n=1 Tax=Vaccinium darrowii TaxID=229202 RepID=A0ACB7YV72_9ERIC|nr:hypothetical protein Vadar_012104 [Vaccinium darrowii]
MIIYVPPIGASERELCKCVHWEMTDMITVWVMESPPFVPCSVLNLHVSFYGKENLSQGRSWCWSFQEDLRRQQEKWVCLDLIVAAKVLLSALGSLYFPLGCSKDLGISTSFDTNLIVFSQIRG